MNKNVSYKTAMTFATANTISIDTKELVIITAAGTLTGTAVLSSNKDSDSAPITFMRKIETQANEASGSSGEAILLKNATLLTASGIKEHFSHLYVFTSDIIALTCTGRVND